MKKAIALLRGALQSECLTPYVEGCIRAAEAGGSQVSQRDNRTAAGFPAGLRRGDLGMQRSRIAPLLTGEDVAELLALADFCIGADGSLHFVRPSDLACRLKALRLVEWVRRPDLGRGARLHRLTKLGWLTLLTRAEHEMRHFLPQEDVEDDA